MLVAKHISMLEIQHASGCLREKAVEPTHIFIHYYIIDYSTSHKTSWKSGISTVIGLINCE